MFAAIGSTLGRMFGTDKAVGKLIDNTSNALDKLVYTSEEKAEDKARAITEARQMVVSWMAATSGQNLARRFLALSITCAWLGQYLAMTVLSTTAVWLPVETANKLRESAQTIGDYAEQMNGAMMLILGFYFAAPFMGDIAKGALQKFGGKQN